MVGKAQRDVASADKHACLDVVASSTLSDVGAGDEGDTPVGPRTGTMRTRPDIRYRRVGGLGDPAPARWPQPPRQAPY